MRIVMFYHSLLSDWNHGNAHFLRGVMSELVSRGHHVDLYEPRDGWSLQNLIADHGQEAIESFHRAYPGLTSHLYDPQTLDIHEALHQADLVIVHEWSKHELVARIGEYRRKRGRFRLLFHDTHHRCVSDRPSMAAYDLFGYDGVLAFGEVIRQIYLREAWVPAGWTWHEAADTRTFYPMHAEHVEGDLVWIGNWGDEERTAELHEFLIEPVKRLRLKARVYGVRYPEHARRALAEAGIEYGGYLPNFRAPDVFGRFRLTVHVPRRYYTQALPGIPTIRPFEAMACGIPMISAPWSDSEGLFTPGEDFLVAHTGREMTQHLTHLLDHPSEAHAMARRGRRTILDRHTCVHRVDQLEAICRELGLCVETQLRQPQLNGVMTHG